MTFDADNFIWFYLIMALLAVGVGLVAIATKPRDHSKNHKSRH